MPSAVYASVYAPHFYFLFSFLPPSLFPPIFPVSPGHLCVSHHILSHDHYYPVRRLYDTSVVTEHGEILCMRLHVRFRILILCYLHPVFFFFRFVLHFFPRLLPQVLAYFRTYAVLRHSKLYRLRLSRTHHELLIISFLPVLCLYSLYRAHTWALLF